MWIPARFNYLIEQGKEKLHLFEVVFKTNLTQTNSKKLTPRRSLRGIQQTYFFVRITTRKPYINLQDIRMSMHEEKNLSDVKCEYGGEIRWGISPSS